MSNWPAPCVLCGYNGPGFYQPTKHPCMSHATERDALLAEVERLQALTEILKGTLRDIEYDKDKVAERQKAAMLAAINHDSYASYDGAEVVSILKAVPLVTEGDK